MRSSVELTEQRRARIRDRLEQSGMKKSELARRLGVNPGTVTKLLGSQQSMSEETARQLADALDIDVGEFLDQYVLTFDKEHLEQAAAEMAAQLKSLGEELGQIECTRLRCIVGLQVVSTTERTYQRVFEIPVTARRGAA